ncbi:MAG: hypothetical protein JXR63_09145 [Spirochaetales bacterium]|nr:hypothetical protein [Spirochaetales bacterium]
MKKVFFTYNQNYFRCISVSRQKHLLLFCIICVLSLLCVGCPLDPDGDGYYDPEALQSYAKSDLSLSMPSDYPVIGVLSSITCGKDFIYGLFIHREVDIYDAANIVYWRILKFSRQDRSLVGEVSGIDYSVLPENITFSLGKGSDDSDLITLLFSYSTLSEKIQKFTAVVYDSSGSKVNESPDFFITPSFVTSYYRDCISIDLLNDDFIVVLYSLSLEQYYYSYSSSYSNYYDFSLVQISSGLVRDLTLNDGSALFLRNYACENGYLYSADGLNIRTYKFLTASNNFELVSSFFYGAVSSSGKAEQIAAASETISVRDGKAFFFKKNLVSCADIYYSDYLRTLYVLDLATSVFEIVIRDSGASLYEGVHIYTSSDGQLGRHWYFSLNGSEIISNRGGIFVSK